jgi:hypothetical protein
VETLFCSTLQLWFSQQCASRWWSSLTGWQQLSTMCQRNLLPPSPDCSLLDGEIGFLHTYQFTGQHIFIRTRFVGVYKCRPLQQLTHKGGTYRIQYKLVIVNDLVAVKYKSYKNQLQASAVKSNRLFIYYKQSSPACKTFICSVKLDEGRKSKWNWRSLLIPYTLNLIDLQEVQSDLHCSQLSD